MALLVPVFVVMLVQPEARLGTVVLAPTVNDKSSWKLADEEGVQLVVPPHAPPCEIAAQAGDAPLSERNRISHFISRCTPRSWLCLFQSVFRPSPDRSRFQLPSLHR